MAFRIKAYLVSLFGILAVSAGAICFMLGDAWLWQKTQNGFLALAGGLLWLIVANVIFLVVVKLLKCPRCGRRFGWENYSFGWFYWFFPNRDCPHCGFDLFAARKDKAADMTRDLRS